MTWKKSSQTLHVDYTGFGQMQRSQGMLRGRKYETTNEHRRVEPTNCDAKLFSCSYQEHLVLDGQTLLSNRCIRTRLGQNLFCAGVVTNT